MALQTWVARFVVDHGSVTEEGGRLRSFERRRLDEPDVDLHIIAEPDGAKGEELGSQALDAIGRLFLQDRLSLTGGIVRALKSTHQTLLDWNRRSLPREQARTGVTAAIVSGPVVFLAQAGPGLAYLRHAGVLRRLEPLDEAYVALGDGELEPAIRRIDLEDGDIVLAASTSLTDVVDDGTLDAMLTRGSDEALPELYLLTRDLESFALFAISCSQSEDETPAEEDVTDTVEEPPPIARREAPQPRIEQERPRSPFPDREEQPRPPPARRDARPRVTSLPPQRTQTRVFTPPPTREAPAREPALPQQPPESEPTFTPPPEEPRQEPLLMAPPIVDISRPVVRLRNEPATRSDYARTTGPSGGVHLNIADPRLLQIGAVVVVVLAIIAFVPGLVRQGRGEKLDELVASAQTQFATAETATDPAIKRKALEETRRLAGEAIRIDPVNQTANDLRQQASTSLTAMDAVFDLSPLTTITTLSRQLTGEISVDSVVVDNDRAYLLDVKGGRLIAVALGATGPPAVLFQEGETYGGTPAKKPIFFARDDSSDGGSRLLVLDEERKLFEVRGASRPAPVPLRRTNTWQSVAGIAAYDGNLYVLDPTANQVHRYLPSAEGFDSEPNDILASQQDLEGAQGIAVDGDVFVYFKDGSMRRYQSGTNLGFAFGGIDRLPKAAIDMTLVPASDEIYLADSGNKRIVVAGADGTFRRQLVSNAFTDLRAIAIDPAATQIYVVVADALLTAPLVR